VFLPKPKLQRHHRFRTNPSGTKNHSESECKSLWFLKAPIVRTMQHSVFTACAYGPRSSCTCNQNMTPCQRILGAFALCCVNSTTTVQQLLASRRPTLLDHCLSRCRYSFIIRVRATNRSTTLLDTHYLWCMGVSLGKQLLNENLFATTNCSPLLLLFSPTSRAKQRELFGHVRARMEALLQKSRVGSTVLNRKFHVVLKSGLHVGVIASGCQLMRLQMHRQSRQSSLPEADATPVLCTEFVLRHSKLYRCRR
jgi:hypothetical protein